MAKKTKNNTGQEAEQKKPRKTEFSGYQSFRLQKRIKGEKVTGSFRLMRQALKVLGKNWRLFAGIVFWYALLNIVLVQGFQVAGNLSESKGAFDQVFSGNLGELAASASLFVYLLGATGEMDSATTATYQVLLAIVFSLAFIWAFRQIYAKREARVRDSFYLGMTPLVTFFLVILVIVLQLVPFVAGAALYSTVLSSEIAATLAEQILWAVLFFVLALVSLYMITSSLFALYIAALPGMAPLHALRSARQLVRNRRWSVLRRIIFLPVAFLVVAAVLVIPFIFFATPVAGWVLFAVTVLMLPVAHSYMYALYRALI